MISQKTETTQAVKTTPHLSQEKEATLEPGSVNSSVIQQFLAAAFHIGSIWSPAQLAWSILKVYNLIIGNCSVPLSLWRPRKFARSSTTHAGGYESGRQT